MNSRTDVLLGATGVSSQPPFRLEIELRIGENILLDLEKLIQQRDVYWRLRQPRYFSMVSVDPLGEICWPEGEDLAQDGLDRYMVSKE
jgi:hypothetical protein